MDNCGGGGQRLPPDGDEFPAAYQEFTSPSQQYQYVTTRESMAANGEVDRGESGDSSFVSSDKTLLLNKSLTETRTSLLERKESSEYKGSSLMLDTESEKTTQVSSYVLYSTQKSLVPSHLAEKKIDIASYYSKDDDASKSEEDEEEEEIDEGPEAEACPPPLPLTGPPKLQERKFAPSGELWRQDNRSEKSVKDKIAMFSSQSSLEAPLFPTPIAASAAAGASPRRLAKHKSSDDVFAEEKRAAMAERTQSSFDLSGQLRKQQPPSLPQSSPPASLNGYHQPPPPLPKPAATAPLSYAPAYSPSPSPSHAKSFDASSPKSPAALTRATSFSGSPCAAEKLLGSELLASPSSIARTTSLASTFKRPNDEIRKSSLNQLIEQRRKGISKLRGLVIPEKDALPIEQPITDLPEIKSRESILVSQVPRSNLHDKWGSQSSLASNASVSSSVRTSGSFKMPAPKILSSYSPAFKRKSLSVYNNNNNNNNSNNNNSPTNNGSLTNGSTKSSNGSASSNQLSSPASEAPKSLESICSPTRSDYSFDFVSSSGSPENNLPASKPKLSCGQRKIGRNEYDDSDNDSAVSSSQSSISRGFSPPMSPVPSSERSSTVSSERSYLSGEAYPRHQLILDGKSNGHSSPDKLYIPGNGSLRSSLMTERSFSVPDKPLRAAAPASSHIPQRQALRRSSSTETSSSSCSSTLTSGSQVLDSRRVLKPQSVEAINRKNILASARCRSGRDLNGSPLIQRKFSDEEEEDETTSTERRFVNSHRLSNGVVETNKPEIKIAYIEITENLLGEKKEEEEERMMQQQPRLPPKRSVIPQAKSVPIPSSRPPKPELSGSANDMRSWVRSEMRNLTGVSSIDRSVSFDGRKAKSETVSPSIRNFRSKSTLALNEQNPSTPMVSRSQSIDGEVDLELNHSVKPKSRSSLGLKKSGDSDLLNVLTTKSRSRSAIHMEDGSYGRLKSQMSLEDILGAKGNSEPVGSKLPRSLSLCSDSRAEDKGFSSKIPSLSSRTGKLLAENLGEINEPTEMMKTSGIGSKIPTARNLGRRSSSVTDMKKVFEKVDQPTNGLASNVTPSSNGSSHNRFPSLDSSAEESIRPIGRDCEPADLQERSSGEQFGSISSLASSTSLISQQELAQLVEEANLEEPRAGGHDVAVVLLHKENPAGSVGIILAGGLDCETKEITIHRVLTHSIADKEGSVQRGDRILSINGRSMRGLTHRESLAVLKQPRSEVVLVVSRPKPDEARPEPPPPAPKIRSRASTADVVEGCKANGVVDNTAWGPPIVVEMYKDGTGLGFSLEGGHDSPLGDRPLLIKKIFTGGAAEKTGALEAGDQLLEVNNRDVSRMSRIEAWSLMKKLPDGEVSLLVRHPATKSSAT